MVRPKRSANAHKRFLYSLSLGLGAIRQTRDVPEPEILSTSSTSLRRTCSFRVPNLGGYPIQLCPMGRFTVRRLAWSRTCAGMQLGGLKGCATNISAVLMPAGEVIAT